MQILEEKAQKLPKLKLTIAEILKQKMNKEDIKDDLKVTNIDEMKVIDAKLIKEVKNKRNKIQKKTNKIQDQSPFKETKTYIPGEVVTNREKTRKRNNALNVQLKVNFDEGFSFEDRPGSGHKFIREDSIEKKQKSDSQNNKEEKDEEDFEESNIFGGKFLIVWTRYINLK